MGTKTLLALTCGLLLTLSLPLGMTGCGGTSTDAAQEASTAATTSATDDASADEDGAKASEEASTASGSAAVVTGDEVFADLMALDDMDDRDECYLRVTGASVKPDGGDEEIGGGADELDVVVKNESSVTVTGVRLLVVGIDQFECYEPVLGGSRLAERAGCRFVTVGTVDDILLTPGTDERLRLGADLEIGTIDVVDARAIVLSYTDTEGHEYDNPIADEWAAVVEGSAA